MCSSDLARKGLADTALRTADSGYLTRRLVDVSHNVIVRDYDCGTEEGVDVSAFTDGKEVLEKLSDRIAGRTAAEDIVDPETGEILVKKGEEIDDLVASKIENLGIETIKIRSVMTCRSKSGVCAKCYGKNLATGEEVNIGESVGITAAQSIGEPGTQLTMRTFHTGGVAGSDITQGLPRVEELFEARKPKGLAEICEEDGVVQGIETRPNGKTGVTIISSETGESKTYDVPYNAIMAVKEGQEIKAGENITRGPLNPHDIFKLKGVKGVYDYLLMEVQRVYRNQGVDINDKHIEIIASQMLSKFKIEDPGDTDLLPGGMYGKIELEEANDAVEAEGKAPALAKQLLLGITKASLATSSFLSAASFQETTRVLTDAAIKGKTDRLLGLKENVIIGKLIPAGTGMKRYKNVKVDYGENEEYVNSFQRIKEEAERIAEEAELEDSMVFGGDESEMDDELSSIINYDEETGLSGSLEFEMDPELSKTMDFLNSSEEVSADPEERVVDGGEENPANDLELADADEINPSADLEFADADEISTADGSEITD